MHAHARSHARTSRGHTPARARKKPSDFAQCEAAHVNLYSVRQGTVRISTPIAGRGSDDRAEARAWLESFYAQLRPKIDALQALARGSNTHFDPRLLQLFKPQNG